MQTLWAINTTSIELLAKLGLAELVLVRYGLIILYIQYHSDSPLILPGKKTLRIHSLSVAEAQECPLLEKMGG